MSPDGKLIAYVGARVDGPSPHDLYTIPLTGGAAKNLTAASIDRPVGQYEWRPDGSILATFQFGFQNKLYHLSSDGKATPMAGFDVNPGAFNVSAGGEIVFSGETATQLPDLWLSNAKGASRRLTHMNDAWQKIKLAQ